MRLYRGWASTRKISSLASFLGFSAGELPFTYFGVPFFVGKPKKVHLQPIVHKILNKMTTWKGSTLSIMGRVELVDKGIRNFVWCGDIGKKKLVNVAWSKVCSSMQSGGLRLRSMKLMNKAALLKLAWDMRSSNQDWTKFYRTRFGASSCYPTRSFKSSIWSGIRDNWSLVNMNLIWLVGDGLQINFWKDNWIGDSLVDILGLPHEIHDSLIVKDLWNWLRQVLSYNLNSISMHSLLLSCITQQNSQVKDVMVIAITHTISTIWFCRNQAKFEDKNIYLYQVVAKIKREVSLSGQTATTSPSLSLQDLLILTTFNVTINLNMTPSIVEVIWQPPRVDWLKVNTNGAANGSLVPTGGSEIFRDSNGVFIACFASYLEIQDALYAELYSAMKVIHMAYKRGWWTLWLKCDSTLVVDIFNDVSNAHWKLQN
ncbi:hypothetical protein Lal_00012008 [Lupinus albus]|nr:hypothetical protein Lal_00012008 [Lupinus albus]